MMPTGLLQVLAGDEPPLAMEQRFRAVPGPAAGRGTCGLIDRGGLPFGIGLSPS